MVGQLAPMLQVPRNYAKLIRLWRGEPIAFFVLKAGFERLRLMYARKAHGVGRVTGDLASGGRPAHPLQDGLWPA